MSASPAFEDWKARALAVEILDAANARGAKLKRQGQEWVGPCPACGGDDRFSVHPRKRIFNCGHQGGAGGDVIALVQHVEGVDFMTAVERLTGEPPPRGTPSEADPEAERERREERRDRELVRDEEDHAERERRMSAAERLLAACEPIVGSHAHAYLRRRRIALTGEQAADLRFHPALPYEGYAHDQADELETLGTYPAMVAAIRDVTGTLIGAHRTYLAHGEPVKLVPPGCRKRNKAKKVLGAAKGGAIWLGPVRPDIALGEGIETTLSWHALGRGPEDITPVAGVSLGNIAGGSTGTNRVDGRTISNGEPDPERPGIVLPPAVRNVLLLGDGDSHRAFTWAALMTAATRFRAAGLVVEFHLAPDNRDWSDVWTAMEAA